jgi:PAS domain S-box-containing protein
MIAWERVFQAISDPAMILDTHHRVLSANPAAERLATVEPGGLVGKHCSDVFHGTEHPPAECPRMALGRLQKPVTQEMEMESIGGTFLVTVAPIYDAAENLVCTVHIAKDLSACKRAEQATQEAKYRVLQQTLKHEHYVREVADRLRNPLHVLMGYLELLPEENLSKTQREYLDHIRRASKRLLQGLNQLT